MLVFIIPLKSAKVSYSWVQVSKLFERTIRSVCNQTSLEFRVIVVCHEQPDIEFEHSNVTYLQVNFPLPAWEVNTDHASRDTDKQKKIFTGLMYARQFNPTHIMFVDADDCVSKHLAKFVLQNPESNGWMFDKGYEYFDGSKSILLRQKGFCYRCGTSSIVKYELIAPDKNMKVDNIDRKWLFHGNQIKKQLFIQGVILDTLPFLGAVYITNHGDNIRNQITLELQRANSILQKMRFLLLIIGKRFLSQKLVDSIREEFSLYDINNLNLVNIKYLDIQKIAN
ncbi:MAG: glycosyltransferase family 2 protein [Pleurocapsa sp. SU_5_0]|nr:glycosyltransferase family 2 protein [Pleurocapsa sp. SU_5_0]NJO98062.1 glycosyltransferase family 2 protein [Pleurocapsa sp. CRU_1_2]